MRVLVSLVSNGQEYALPIEAVEEILPFPEQLAAVPHTDGRVLGVAAQRGRLLPLVPLRALLGWPAAAEAPRKVAVVRADGAPPIGLVVDRPGEILRVAASSLQPVPPLLTRGGRLEVGAICRLDEGRRLVSVLSPENLLRHDAVREAIAAGDREGGEMAQPDPGTEDGMAEAEFVVFRLAGEEYAVPIGEVDEVLPLQELTRVPRAPDFIEGVMNLRGTVLPVVDQRRRFGLPAAPRTGRERIMVHTVGAVRAGFIVDSVARVLRVSRMAVGPAPELSRGEAPLVAGVVSPPDGDRLVLVLDVARLLDREEASELAGMEAAG
jgi:purine-binding chemotaxis protein CheW